MFPLQTWGPFKKSQRLMRSKKLFAMSKKQSEDKQR